MTKLKNQIIRKKNSTQIVRKKTQRFKLGQNSKNLIATNLNLELGQKKIIVKKLKKSL